MIPAVSEDGSAVTLERYSPLVLENVFVQTASQKMAL